MTEKKTLPLMSSVQRVTLVNQLRSDAGQFISLLDRATAVQREMKAFEFVSEPETNGGIYPADTDPKLVNDYLKFLKEYEKFLEENNRLALLYSLIRR